jgi:hypothetical protein
VTTGARSFVNIHEVEGLKASVETSEPAKHFDSVPGLVWAFRIHDDGAAEQLPIDQPIPIRPQGWIWLHLDLACDRFCRRGQQHPNAVRR